MGKSEGKGDLWHGHVTCLTVDANYRRLGLAERLMKSLEQICESVDQGYFVDLFVRQSNELAINMYKKFGYVIYRRILDYYSGDEAEDAYGKIFAIARIFQFCVYAIIIKLI